MNIGKTFWNCEYCHKRVSDLAHKCVPEMSDDKLTLVSENRLRELLAKEAQLNEAREVIGYYANRCNWSNADELCWDSVIDEEDHESIFGVNAVGGKRARAFLDKTKGQES